MSVVHGFIPFGIIGFIFVRILSIVLAVRVLGEVFRLWAIADHCNWLILGNFRLFQVCNLVVSV